MIRFRKKISTITCMGVLILLGACTQDVSHLGAQEPVDDTACVLDGMLLKSFAGPKAQIVYADGKPDFFCNVMELFDHIFSLQSKRRVVAMYVQDAGKIDWEHPDANWIDAKTAIYVVGSKKAGAMGATFGTFSTMQSAENFVKAEGGKIVHFDQINPDMLTMTNSSKSDVRM